MHLGCSNAVLATGPRALTGAIGVAGSDVGICEQVSTVIATVTEPVFLETESHV